MPKVTIFFAIYAFPRKQLAQSENYSDCANLIISDYSSYLTTNLEELTVPSVATATTM